MQYQFFRETKIAFPFPDPARLNFFRQIVTHHCMSMICLDFVRAFFSLLLCLLFSLFSFSHSLKLQTSSQNHQNPSLRDLSFASFFFSVSGDSLMSRIYSSLSGGELFEKITSEGYSMSEAEVINYMRQICEGVKHMHERNIIHLGK